jgi:hypothetical protein
MINYFFGNILINFEVPKRVTNESLTMLICLTFT